MPDSLQSIVKMKKGKPMKPHILAAATLACCFGAIALAHAASTARIRGTIASFDGRAMVVTTRDGPQVTVNVPETARIASLKKIDLSAIKPGTFIGTAARPGPGGELQAIEVLVFPESGRGTGEGHYAWDLAPGTTMTNATVSAAVESRSGRELNLSYKGGSVKVVVPPGAPVVTPVPAERSDLKPRAPVFLSASKDATGELAAKSVVVGKDGVAPPM
jgi:hypothetical protein